MNGTESTYTVAAAIVAHAAHEGMGEPPPLDDVLAALRRLRDDPSGAEHLSKAIRDLNNKDSIGIIRSWCIRLLEIDESAARDASRMSGVIMQPVQGVFFSSAAAASLAMVIGTLGVLPGAVLLVASAGAAGTATYGRWRLSRVEDTRKRDAERTKRLLAALKG